MKDTIQARCNECGRDLTDIMEVELKTLTCWCGESFSDAEWFSAVVWAGIKNAEKVEILSRLVKRNGRQRRSTSTVRKTARIPRKRTA